MSNHIHILKDSPSNSEGRTAIMGCTECNSVLRNERKIYTIIKKYAFPVNPSIATRYSTPTIHVIKKIYRRRLPKVVQ